MNKKAFNDEISEINNRKKNGMDTEYNDNYEADYSGKDFAKNKIAFNLYDMIK